MWFTGSKSLSHFAQQNKKEEEKRTKILEYAVQFFLFLPFFLSCVLRSIKKTALGGGFLYKN